MIEVTRKGSAFEVRFTDVEMWTIKEDMPGQLSSKVWRKLGAGMISTVSFNVTIFTPDQHYDAVATIRWYKDPVLEGVIQLIFTTTHAYHAFFVLRDKQAVAFLEQMVKLAD